MAFNETDRILVFNRLSQLYSMNRMVRSLYPIAGSCSSNYNRPNTALYILVLVISNIIFLVWVPT
jgi:hypothetical protein